MAFLFGTLCLFLIRLNHRLKGTISAHETTELALTKLSSAVTNSGSLIVITDGEGIIEYVNEKFCQITQYRRSESIGRSILMLSGRNASETRSETTWNLHCLNSGWEGELLSRKKDGSEFWSAITISAVFDRNNAVSNYVISGIDISAIKEISQKMEHLALYDSLTGLANRRLFIDRLNQSIQSAKRHNSKVALFFLDLDQFKRINDTLGHDAGDALLLTVAERLQSCVRAQDTVSRLGGDEFTILLNDLGDTNAATTVAKHILRVLKEPIKLDKHEVIVSTSIGITISPDDSVDTDTLMKNADLALYRAKEQGRDGYHFFTEELNIKALRLLNIEQELRHALSSDEFNLLYQPQINLKTGEISSVEALIRWHHPVRGEVPPGEFIAVAEETGLIVSIGEWVLRNACIQTKMLQELTGQKIRVAVNLSTRQFTDPNLEHVISDTLKSTGLDAKYLEIEVTESMLMDDIQKVILQLNRIKATGSMITIDDFGSGYSSLSYLKRLPVDILKVDREFVRDIPDDLSDMEITSAVIAVAHKLNLKVIAEGVETIDQRDFLMINKCDYAQGYLFSKPLSFEDLYRFFTVPERKTA
ncbi:MAG: EAL domain-containing protein [Hahellaceae bacterium]|nr:EAL domain-containing protein [Hahellaceae bacterium]